MKKEFIIKLHNDFEQITQTNKTIEFWYARDLQGLLGYNEWRNFIQVINKAKQACENSGHVIRDHFVDVNKMVSLGSGSRREIEDIKLTRYACYLIAQNGEPIRSKTWRQYYARSEAHFWCGYFDIILSITHLTAHTPPPP